MGKYTGFMEYLRQMPSDKEPLSRIGNWNEFHNRLSEEEQRIQGARCMDCGIPFCHSGIILNGMASGCPVNNLIPEWNDLAYKGLWKEATARLLKTNNFPEFTGRVCPAPCEGACTVGLNDTGVTIKNNECYIIDKAFEEGWIVPNPPSYRTGKNVAVVGSGPAGLACADQLNKVGHNVTVYERADRVGGLLMYGIPNMKLDKSLVKRRIDLMAMEGINFITDTNIFKHDDTKRLLEEFDAVVICTGATKPRDLIVEGRNLAGIYFAVDFLHLNTKSLLDSEHGDRKLISAKGKDVVVIGGGDTGTDCVATSLRHKCKSVVQFEIMPQPPKERQENNPWPEWPKVLKVDYGQEEAMEVFGKDPREYCIMTERFVGDNIGKLKEIHTVKIKWEKDEKGRGFTVPIRGTEKVWPVDLAFISMGFLGPEDEMLKNMGIERDVKTNIKTDCGKYKTNIEGVFAAGDCRRGQSLVVWAIKEGREAARECDSYLMGGTNLP